MLRPMLLSACCAAVVLASAPSPHGGWSALENGPSMELDRRRIVRDGARVDVWVRQRGDRDAVAAEFEAAGVGADDVERVRAGLGRSEHRWAFRCDDRMHALAVSAYYATDGALIREFRVERLAWWPVQADTVGQRLLREVCGPARRDAVAGSAPDDRDGRDDGDDERADEDDSAAAPR